MRNKRVLVSVYTRNDGRATESLEDSGMTTQTKLASTIFLFLLACAGSATAGGVERVDVSPAVLVNMAEGHSGDYMGAAITGDVFFGKALALRTTVGFTKERYYPAELDYADADYGFWLSLAPYAELNVGDRVMPYLALLGTFTTGTQPIAAPTPIGMEQAPYARVSQDARNSSFYSLGVSLGSKLRIAGPVAVYGEFSHYFFTSTTDSKVYYGPELGPFGREYDFERNPTYISFGLTYSLDLSK